MTITRLAAFTLLTACHLPTTTSTNVKTGNCSLELPANDTVGQAGTVTATFMGTAYTTSCFTATLASNGFSIDTLSPGPTERFQLGLFFGNAAPDPSGVGTTPCSYSEGTPVKMSDPCLSLTCFGYPPSGMGLWDFEAIAGHGATGQTLTPAPTGTVTPIAIPTVMGQLFSATFSADATLWYSPAPGAPVTLIPITGSAAVDTSM